MPSSSGCMSCDLANSITNGIDVPSIEISLASGGKSLSPLEGEDPAPLECFRRTDASAPPAEFLPAPKNFFAKTSFTQGLTLYGTEPLPRDLKNQKGGMPPPLRFWRTPPFGALAQQHNGWQCALMVALTPACEAVRRGGGGVGLNKTRAAGRVRAGGRGLCFG